MRYAGPVALALLLSVGCDGEPPQPDAGGPMEDAGGRADSGVEPMDDAGHLDAGPEQDAGPTPPDSGALDSGGADAGPVDAGPPEVPSAVLPAEGAEVLSSAALRISAPAGAVRVRVEEPVSGASCEATAPFFECLLDLSGAAEGALSVELVAFDAADAEMTRGSLGLVRRALEVPCTGDANALSACLVARAEAGDAAGFAGVSYLNADDSHARVNTSAMTGIDARVLSEPPATPLDDVVSGLMNESRSWQPTGGWCSMPRCNPFSRQRSALRHYEANVLLFFPEHRDHGIRDYYQWQAPFFVLSQGSSSSERDEVARGLRALAAMAPTARARAEAESVVAPIVSMLIRRARHASDVDYLTPEAHAIALTNSAASLEGSVTLATALRADELPPVARLVVDSSMFGADWALSQVLDTPYAVGFAPAAVPATAPSGEFAIEVSLDSSSDVNGRPLVYFPVVLRSAGSAVTVEQTAPDRFTIRGDFPEDETLNTAGQDRIVSRVTVGFFAHNGVWIGAPALVSVGGRPATETAPNANNLD